MLTTLFKMSFHMFTSILRKRVLFSKGGSQMKHKLVSEKKSLMKRKL